MTAAPRISMGSKMLTAGITLYERGNFTSFMAGYLIVESGDACAHILMCRASLDYKEYFESSPVILVPLRDMGIFEFWRTQRCRA